MKRFLSLLLILCLCLGMLAACDEPSSGPSGIPPTEGDGGEGGGTSTTPPAGDGGAEGGTTTTPDSGNGGSTNPGGGNGSGPSGTLPGGGESGGTLPGGGNNGNGTNNAGDIIQPPAGEGRTTVTEMEFEAAKDTPKNYTQVLELKTAGGIAYGAQVRYVATQNGKTTFYEWGEANGSTSGKCAFFRNGTYWGGDYDQESGKWTVYAGGSYSLALPFSGMPYAFSDFTYDEANGE